MKTVMALAVVLFSFNSMAAGDTEPRTDFDRVRWGMSLDALKVAYPEYRLQCKRINHADLFNPGGTDCAVVGLVTRARMDFAALYAFSADGKLRAALFTLENPSQTRRLRDALHVKYGEPEEDEDGLTVWTIGDGGTYVFYRATGFAYFDRGYKKLRSAINLAADSSDL